EGRAFGASFGCARATLFAEVGAAVLLRALVRAAPLFGRRGVLGTGFRAGTFLGGRRPLLGPLALGEALLAARRLAAAPLGAFGPPAALGLFAAVGPFRPAGAFGPL